MSSFRTFTGFESGSATDDLGTVQGLLGWGTPGPRTGDFFYTHYAPQTAVTQISSYNGAVGLATLVNGDRVIARVQWAFRIRQAFSAANALLMQMGNDSGAPGQDNTEVATSATGAIQITGRSIATTSTGFVPEVGVWYVARWHYEYEQTASGDPTTAILQIFASAALDADPDALPLASASYIASPSRTLFTLGANRDFGLEGVSGIYDIDDLFMMGADGADAVITNPVIAWPAGSRIQAVPITGQGNQAQFTGDYLNARKLPAVAVTNIWQVSSGAGQATTFQHDTAATLGLIPEGLLDAAGTEEDVAEAPPFSGAPAPDGLINGWEFLSQRAVVASLPVPTLSVNVTAGAGSFNRGVWVRAYTIEWRSTPGGGTATPYAGPMSAAQFISANEFPNFSATITVTFDPATPADRFLNPATPGTSPYYRYGLGVLVTNAYSDSGGLLNPFGPLETTNTTNLKTQGGTTPIDGNLYGPLVALSASGPSNAFASSPPYPNTFPETRPSVYVFLLASPLPNTTSGVKYAFAPVFAPPTPTGTATDPVVTEMKVYATLSHSVAPTANEQVVIGGVATNVSVSTAVVTQRVYNTTPRTIAEFDALQWGVQTLTATPTRVHGIVAEVVTAGPCTTQTPGTGTYQQAVGIYTPNGTFQTINVGFKPSLVIVKKITTAAAGASVGCVRAWWQGGTLAQTIDASAAVVTGIMLLTENGFLVGPDATANTVSGAGFYVYLAIKDGGQDITNDAFMVTGQYYRQGTSDTQPIPLGVADVFAADWTPDVVWILNNTTNLKTPDIPAGSSLEFSATGLSTTGITAVGSREFAVGALTGPGGVTRHTYVAWRFDAAGLLRTLFAAGAFAGTGGVQVIATPFTPALVVLDHPVAGYTGRFKSLAGSPGNQSTPWPGGSPTTTDITAIGAADFTVGAAASVVGQTSYWLVWKESGAIGDVGDSEIPAPAPPAPPTPPSTDPLCPTPVVPSGS